MTTTPRLRLWGGLLLLAATSESFQRTPSSRAHTRLHASTTLPELLEALKAARKEIAGKAKLMTTAVVPTEALEQLSRLKVSPIY